MRAYLRDIFAEAVDQDFLVKDPARKIKVPAQLRPTDTSTLTWDQLRMALSKLKLRDRILLELDMTNALRPSELFAFQWKCFNYEGCTLTVAEPSTKAASVIGVKRGRALLSFTFRGSLLTTCRHGVSSAKNRLGSSGNGQAEIVFPFRG